MLLQNLQVEFAEAIASEDENLTIVHPAANLKIYQNNICCNLIHSLQEIYPLLSQLLGADYFQCIAKEYIQHYPSRSSDLHEYGEYVGDFLATHSSLQDLFYLSEVAQFEWICHHLFFAADHAALDIKLLANIAPEQYENLYLVLHPATKIMPFHYPILDIIDLCKGNNMQEINANKGGINLLIARPEADIVLTPLSVGEYTFLLSVQENKNLAAALDAALRAEPGFNLEQTLPRWVKNKVIVDVGIF